ncbi:glycosyltransferase [Mariniradius saccharolyticus]|nr:glycosyltransferase [Mariniradius saccharolyticus]
MNKGKIKVLFFIGTLSSGGKERRLLELMTYLNKSDKYALFLVTKQAEVLFDNFYSLQVEWLPLSTSRLTIGSFSEFYQIVKKISPDIIHTWGTKQTLIAVPPKLFSKKIKLVNSQITSAPPNLSLTEKLLSQINFLFSDSILSNSFAGIEAYNPPKTKAEVIYNGLNAQRFKFLPERQEMRKKFGIETRFAVIMVASYSQNKDYERFFKVGWELLKLRQDTTFLGIGYYDDSEPYFRNALEIAAKSPNLKPLPGTFEVEALVNACDIGVLFSNNKVHGEGISNAVIEYMALGKPVIANDAGGTREVVHDQWNGFLIKEESPEEVALMIHNLLENPTLMEEMGRRSEERIAKDFSLDKMGAEFEKVYQKLLN